MGDSLHIDCLTLLGMSFVVSLGSVGSMLGTFWTNLVTTLNPLWFAMHR